MSFVAIGAIRVNSSNWTQGESVPDFLRKPIATCDFPWGSGPPVPPLDPQMNFARQKNVL